MSRNGYALHGLLDELHADGCDGQEYSKCHPVLVPRQGEKATYHDRDGGASIEVVVMEWCGECGAADWEVV